MSVSLGIEEEKDPWMFLHFIRKTKNLAEF